MRCRFSSTFYRHFDRHGSVQNTGLPVVCKKGRLAATTPAQARRSCPGAIGVYGYRTKGTIPPIAGGIE